MENVSEKWDMTLDRLQTPFFLPNSGLQQIKIISFYTYWQHFHLPVQVELACL